MSFVKFNMSICLLPSLGASGRFDYSVHVGMKCCYWLMVKLANLCKAVLYELLMFHGVSWPAHAVFLGHLTTSVFVCGAWSTVFQTWRTELAEAACLCYDRVRAHIECDDATGIPTVIIAFQSVTDIQTYIDTNIHRYVH